MSGLLSVMWGCSVSVEGCHDECGAIMSNLGLQYRLSGLNSELPHIYHDGSPCYLLMTVLHG